MTANILIVDDERSMCELIHADLALRGIASSWCNSASDALQRLREQEFDVVLTDLKVPGSSGLQIVPADLRQPPGYSGHCHDRVAPMFCY